MADSGPDRVASRLGTHHLGRGVVRPLGAVMSAIGPRDFVECAPRADRPREVSMKDLSVKGAYPKPGGIYQVRQCGWYRAIGGKVTPGIRLVGIVVSLPGHPDAWFCADDFRPISGGERGMFDHMLKLDAPSKEPVAA